MLAILPKLVYILTLGPFQTGLEKIPLADKLGGNNGEDDLNLPDSSRPLKIHGRARRSALVVAREPVFVPGSGQSLGQLVENGGLAPLPPLQIGVDGRDWRMLATTTTTNNNNMRQAEQHHEPGSFGKQLIFSLEYFFGPVNLVLSLPGLVLAGIFYLLSDIDALVFLFGFSTWAFAICAGASIVMLFLTQDAKVMSVFLLLSATTLTFGTVTLITAFIGRIYFVFYPPRGHRPLIKSEPAKNDLPKIVAPHSK